MGTWPRHEEPIAYYREGDPNEILDTFRENGLTPEKHEAGYRSIHYLIETQPTKDTYIVELQIRTLIEEAWSEIDHLVKYPYGTSNPIISNFLDIFNRLAGSADEMGTFIMRLESSLAASRLEKELSEKKYEEAENERKEIEQKLKTAIKELKVTGEEKDDLERQVNELSKSSSSISPASTVLELNLMKYTTSIVDPRIDSPRSIASILGPGACSKCGSTMQTTLTGFVCPNCSKKETESG